MGIFSIISLARLESGGLFSQKAEVAMGPGAIQFIVIPYFAISKAQVQLMDKTAPLDAQ